MIQPNTRKNKQPRIALSQRELHSRFQSVRTFTHRICEPLSTEDYVIQSMPDVSPTKWHLAHTTWFFEAFVLREACPTYHEFHPFFNYLFNSYYNTVGDRHARPLRGMLSRPTVDDIHRYRAAVDKAMNGLLDSMNDEQFMRWGHIIELGLHHEQQHQELILTDLKHVLAQNPMHPVYQSGDIEQGSAQPMHWVELDEGVHSIGYTSNGFSYDNESPEHKTYIGPVALGSRLITNHEYMEFMNDGGYKRHELWLSAGWDTIQSEDWTHPMYWKRVENEWYTYTLAGLVPVPMNSPVCHLSYYEADAYARWRDCRLPTEQEWEVAARSTAVEGNLAERERFHPEPCTTDDASFQQLFGDVWEWTHSAYAPYPGYKPVSGALGEYNGKWMCNQYVLRGGSCVTPHNHIRLTYRNFFPTNARWQFSGVRLAKDLTT